MTEEKKVYIAPEMKTVKLEQQSQQLLYASEGALVFPHEQDPIA